MKNWIEIGEHNRPEVITVNLLEDEEAINMTTELENTDWDYVFINQEEYNELLEEYNKKMDEIVLPPKYESANFKNDNPSEVEIETEISGNKIWLDEDSKERPASVIIYLYANENVVDRQVISSEDEWHYRFTNIPVYDESGEMIDYRIEERAVQGYETSYEGWNIINRRSELTEGKIYKKWVQAENIPNSISVSLLQNGTKIEDIILTKEKNWEYLVTDLEIFDENGKFYTYSVQEEHKVESEYPAKILLAPEMEAKQKEKQKIGLVVAGGTLLLLGLASKLRKKD